MTVAAVVIGQGASNSPLLINLAPLPYLPGRTNTESAPDPTFAGDAHDERGEAYTSLGISWRNQRRPDLSGANLRTSMGSRCARYTRRFKRRQPEPTSFGVRCKRMYRDLGLLYRATGFDGESRGWVA